MLPDPVVVTGKVAAIFERLDVPYFIGGSLASTFHGMIRTTQDADLVAFLRPEHTQPLVRSLEAEFYVDAEMIQRAIQQHGSFNIIHRESMFKVDVFIPILRTFERSQLARAQEQALLENPPVRGRIASAEDILLAKLEWYRLGNEVSERQWRDVLGILKVQGENLDFSYLHRFAKELEVEELLQRALDAASLRGG